MAIAREQTASTPAEEDQIIKAQNGDKSKFSRYSIVLTLQGTIRLKAIAFLVSWSLKLLSIALLQYMVCTDLVTPWIAYFVFYQRKLHFLVLGLTTGDVTFYGARVVSHSKLRYSGEGASCFYLSLFSIILMAVDYCEIIIISQKLYNDFGESQQQKNGKNVKNNQIHQEHKKMFRKKRVGLSMHQKRALSPINAHRLKRRAKNSNMNNTRIHKKMNKDKTPELKIATTATLFHLKNDMTIIDFLSSGLNRQNQVLKLAFCALSNFTAMLKMTFHLICLIALVQLPLLQIVLMLVAEVVDMIVTI